MRPLPYIGITGFTSRSEVTTVLKSRSKDSKHLVSVNVLVSSKSLRGEELRQPKRFPAREKIPGIFGDDPQVLNLLHFNTNRPDELLHDMLDAQSLAGPFCHGFQLNMAWPDIGVITEYKKMYPKNTIVLQCGQRVIEEAGSAGALARRVTEYRDIANYVLIDQSGGQGLPLDIILARSYFAEISKEVPTIGLAIAGGLRAEALHKLYTLWKKFSDFSIDAESKLRTDGDDLDTTKAACYLKIADTMFVKRMLGNTEA